MTFLRYFPTHFGDLLRFDPPSIRAHSRLPSDVSSIVLAKEEALPCPPILSSIGLAKEEASGDGGAKEGLPSEALAKEGANSPFPHRIRHSCPPSRLAGLMQLEVEQRGKMASRFQARKPDANHRSAALERMLSRILAVGG